VTFGEEAEEPKKGGGEVIDLMEALQRSVERSRGGASAADAAGTKAAPKKSAAEKKAPAKKAKKPA
jgi:DNA end-binding protein Ku